MARLLTARGRPRAASWINVTASSLNSGSDRPGELEVVGDVPAGLVGCQGGHGVAQGDPLVQGGQHAEAEHPAQGGLAEEQAGQRAGRVHLGVRQDPDGLELVVGHEMSLVEDQQRDTSALVMLGGEQAGGLGGQGGGAVGGPAAERGDHGVVDAAGAGGGVGQVDQGVPGLVQAGDGSARGDRLAGANQTGDRLQHLREMLPCAVRVTAEAHPLSGRTLDALSFIHLRGVLHLVVRLPDSSPGTIPVSATDVFGERAAEGPATVLDADGLRRLRALTLALGGRDGAGR